MFKKKSGKKYFGVELDQDSGEIPELVVKAIEYLEEHLNESGLFRISGQMNVITEIKNKWDKGVHEGFSKQAIPHNVTGVLKLYLKEMPEPLLTFSRYDAFLHLGGEKDLSVRLTETKKLLQGLPRTNYATMKALLSLLNKIAACSAVNNMRAANLSMVFAPNVFRPEVETIEYIVSDTPLTNSEFEFMIENYPSLFDDPSGKTLTTASMTSSAATSSTMTSSEPPPPPPTTTQDATPSGPADPLAMMADDFNMEEWANLGGEMLEPTLGLPGAEDASLMVPQASSTTVAAAAAAGAGDGSNDAVWNFRAQSYVVIENIYEITDIISENIPSVRCISELVYIATLLLETLEGTQCPVEEALPPSAAPPLQHVRDADETRLLPLLELCTDLLTQVADEIGAYVEALAEKMSLVEELEPLRPMDERFRWIENTLARANDAFEEPGAYVPDDPNAVSDVVVDASVIREIPGIPENIDSLVSLEGYVEDSAAAAADADADADVPPPLAPPPPPAAAQQQQIQQKQPQMQQTQQIQQQQPQIAVPPQQQQQQPQVVQQKTAQDGSSKGVQAQIKIQSNVVKTGAVAAAGTVAATAVASAASSKGKEEEDKGKKKEEPAGKSAKTAQTSVKKAEKPKTEGQRRKYQ